MTDFNFNRGVLTVLGLLVSLGAFQVTAEAGPRPSRSRLISPARDDARVARSLQEYLQSYGGNQIGGHRFELVLSTSGPRPAIPGTSKDRARLRVEQAELVALTRSLLPGGQTRRVGKAIENRLFPVLRSIYPRAHLSVTVHDGTRTLTRAEWLPKQVRPETRVL